MERKPTSDDDLTLALQLADAAGAISLSHFRRPIRRWSKTDGSLATEADLAVEDAIRRASESSDRATPFWVKNGARRAPRTGAGLSMASTARSISPRERTTGER
jgi:hypothetical protein